MADSAGMRDLGELKARVREFVAARDWERFHSPKNLAMALSVEASELVELFQWLTAEESDAPDPERRRRVAEELADVLWFLVRLADRLDIDLLEAAELKLAVNEKKYPADRVRGKSAKYSDY
jgi:NTP pyrophosphatase (non-canonical NTP hydrolase)